MDLVSRRPVTADDLEVALGCRAVEFHPILGPAVQGRVPGN